MSTAFLPTTVKRTDSSGGKTVKSTLTWGISKTHSNRSGEASPSGGPPEAGILSLKVQRVYSFSWTVHLTMVSPTALSFKAIYARAINGLQD